MQPTGFALHRLAWVTALLPLLTTHLSYLLSAWYGHVDWCVPYWDSCTSISATGRELPAKLWFKVGMIPGALCGLALWILTMDWRRRAGPTAHPRSLRATPLVGGVAAVFLILYTGALGEEGEAYRDIRRTGVILAFALTYLAQLLTTRLLGELAQARGDAFMLRWYRMLLGLMVVLLTVGVLSVILDAMLGLRYDEIEDAFEWVMALLLNLWFAGLARVLMREDVRVRTVPHHTA